ncbi:MAG: HemK2/MTQ2 family protein methyltransferase [Candidatus Woesearchaeota archaeon]
MKDEERRFLEGKHGDVLPAENKNPIYEPREDSEMLRRHIKDYAKGKILDMGTGSGVLAKEAVGYGEVLAVDKNPDAVSYVKNLGIDAKESDLFSEVDERFDLIIFNPPYLPQDPGVEDMALFGGKKGYEVSVDFISQAADYLERDGKILFLFSSLTKKDKIEEALVHNMFTWKELEKKHIFFEDIYVYLIEKTSARKEIEPYVSDIRYLAQGKRGITYIGIYKGEKVTIKTKRSSSKVNRLGFEAEWLKKIPFAPDLVFAGRNYIVYRYIEGIPMKKFIEDAEPKKLYKVIMRLLDLAYELDKMGINKEEMHRPFTNVLVSDEPHLIDFERAHYTEQPKNVTQFCQFLHGFRKLLAEKGIKVDKITSAARKYKEDRDISKVRSCISNDIGLTYENI